MTTNKQTLNLSNETFERQSITIRRKKQQTPKQAAYNFFLKHGACSYEPAKETKRQGYARMARLLAKAERDARALGYTFTWEDDWTVDNHFKEYGECYKNGEPSTCECCTMFAPDGTHPAIRMSVTRLKNMHAAMFIQTQPKAATRS